MRARIGLIVVMLVVAACGGGDDGPSAERLCDVQAEIAAIPLFTGGTTDEARQNVGQLQTLADEMVEAAPDDVRAAAESSHDAAETIWELFESVDYDETLITQEQIDGVASIAREGSADLLAWVDANCGA